MKNITHSAILFLSVTLFISAVPAGTCAAWSNDPTVNTAVSMAFDHQYNHQIVPDGSGGAIITWEDYRARYGTMADIYAQRVDWKGKVLWTLDGVAVSIAPNDQLKPKMVSDGSGGAVIVWEDSRNGNLDIYAQRVDSNGNLLWQPDGVAICTTAQPQEWPQITSDGAGGAIITWSDGRNGKSVIYAQRIDAEGQVWVADGVAVSEPSSGHYPQIASDGAGGAVISWTYRVQDEITAQRVDADGNVLWETGGVAISTGASGAQNIQMAPDGNGGTILVWEDSRNGGEADIYAQRIDANGNVKWASDVLVRNAIYRQEYPQITSDGAGGAVIAWLNTQDGKIYAQKISGNGILQWKVNGVPVRSTPPSYQLGGQQIVGDGKSGAIITWQSYTGVYHLYAQRVSGDGKVMWLKDGVAISTASGNQGGPKLVRDGQGGAIIAFVNNIDGMTDLYAQKVSAKGQLQPVQVFSPNGGEVISSGSTGGPVEWGAPAEADSFKLLYSIDDGLTWEMIDQGQIGSPYPWDVPLLTRNNSACRIKVIGYDTSNVKVGSDVSDGPFTIEVLTITYPQNGSTCTRGQTCTITWEKAPAVDAQTGRLFYSVDGGLTWILITDTITGGDTSFDWKPSVKTTKKNCKVKLIYRDGAEKKVGIATSPGKFRIAVP